MKTRVVTDNKYYYVQLLKSVKQGFASEFMPMKWEYYGHLDEEGVFNRQPFVHIDDARNKARMLAEINAIEIVAEFE